MFLVLNFILDVRSRGGVGSDVISSFFDFPHFRRFWGRGGKGEKREEKFHLFILQHNTRPRLYFTKFGLFFASGLLPHYLDILQLSLRASSGHPLSLMNGDDDDFN